MNDEIQPSYEFKMDLENKKVIQSVIFKNFKTDNECKFCFEKNNLIFPCNCHTGVHEKCLKKWLHMKRTSDPNKCEICLKNYNFNYVVIRNRSPRHRNIRINQIENTVIPVRNNSRFLRKYSSCRGYIQFFTGIGILLILVMLIAYSASCLDNNCIYIYLYIAGGCAIIVIPTLILDCFIIYIC